ncbi:MAG: hypothetical protein HYX82_04745 [Chloroflexi bacterium]|nr:hypothetical protein [Chloroflexota bacterium]
MDSDFRLDIGEVGRNIESAEVISLYFPLLRKTLLMDTRHNGGEEPMIKVVPMVDSVEERFRSLRKLRPRLPKPDSITVIPWPKYVGSIVRLGIWDKIVQRFVATGHKEAVKACEEALKDLLEFEKTELAAVIKGEHYYTLWEAKK